MSLVIKFYFTSSMLNMFRILIHPTSGAWEFFIVSPHWPCVLVSICVGVSVLLGWGGIRVAGWSTASVLQPATRIPLSTCARDGHLYTRGCIIQFWPPDDEHMCSKHEEAWSKLIVIQILCIKLVNYWDKKRVKFNDKNYDNDKVIVGHEETQEKNNGPKRVRL